MIGGDLSYRERALRAEARVAELEAACAAWREMRDVGEGDPLFRKALIWVGPQRAGGRGGVARLIVFMLAHPGLVLSRARIADAVSLRDFEARDGDSVASVVVCIARKVLRQAGLDDAIETHARYGWRLTPDAAARLREILAEVVA